MLLKLWILSFFIKHIDVLFYFQYTECRRTLRKESSSRKPLRHKNINEFSSDDIPKKSVKRKRHIKDEQVNIISCMLLHLKRLIQSANRFELALFFFLGIIGHFQHNIF